MSVFGWTIGWVQIFRALLTCVLFPILSLSKREKKKKIGGKVGTEHHGVNVVAIDYHDGNIVCWWWWLQRNENGISIELIVVKVPSFCSGE